MEEILPKGLFPVLFLSLFCFVIIYGIFPFYLDEVLWNLDNLDKKLWKYSVTIATIIVFVIGFGIFIVKGV